MEISFKANIINRTQAEHFYNKISKAKKIDIICHKSADEDAIACAKAIYWLVNKLNKQARIFTDSTDAFRVLEDNKFIINTSKGFDIKDRADTIFCVDFSSFTRVNNRIANYIKTAKNLLCLDHHENPDISNNFIEIREKLNNKKINKLRSGDVYVDTTSKSCSAIVLRLFQALNIFPPKRVNESLFCGMTDDLRKHKYISYDSSLEPIKSDLFKKDKTTFNLYEDLSNKLTKKEKDNIISHLNIFLNLNSSQKGFQKRLSNEMKIAANGKFAYTVIPPNNKEWNSLGGDNLITSGIMGDFRIKTIEKNKDIDSVAVFYQDKNGYKVSIHSKKGKILDLFEYIKKTYSNIQCGGHPDRGGASIQTFDEKLSLDWANKIIKEIEDFYIKC